MVFVETELINAMRSAKYSPDVIFTGLVSSPSPISGYKDEELEEKEFEETMDHEEDNNKVKENFKNWLDNVELRINPFNIIDASRDPFIPFYLIDLNQYNFISGTFSSSVFALPGSGKSAFRVRLTRDCRIGKDGRKVFPIVYELPAPERLRISPDRHYEKIAQSASLELMLYLVYHIPSIIKDEILLSKFQEIFDSNHLINYIQQMADHGNVQPLLDSFDQTARLLPNPPTKEDLVILSQKLKSIRGTLTTVNKISCKQRFEQVISFVIDILGYNAIYILVDDIDGYLETSTSGIKTVEAISWLVTKNQEWQKNNIYLKFFLPLEDEDIKGAKNNKDIESSLEKKFPLLTFESKVTIINWNVDTLSQVIQQRLQEASGGKYNSLRAISSLPLRGARLSPEEKLAHKVMEFGNPTPRKLIQAVNMLFHHHVQVGQHEKLTPEDLQAAIDWLYKRSLNSRHA